MTAEEFGKKWDNYWYYHKWHTLFAVFIAIVILFGVVQCSSVVKPDLIVAMVTTGTQLDQTTKTSIEQNMTKYVGDVNKDGKTIVSIRTFYLSPKLGQQIDYTMAQKLMGEMETGDCMLFMVDDGGFKYLQNIKVLQKMSDALPGAKTTDGCRIAIKDLSSFHGQPFSRQTNDMAFTVRVFKGTTIDNKKNELNYSKSIEALKNMVENTPVNP